jgi:hypothetical protein
MLSVFQELWDGFVSRWRGGGSQQQTWWRPMSCLANVFVTDVWRASRRN